jgi:hypothetical protein
MILVSTIIFETQITPLNGAGIAVVLLGSARYSYVSVVEQQHPPPHRSISMMKRDLSAVALNTGEDDDDDMADVNNGRGGTLSETVPLTSKDLGV